jgi:hypothetical protein
MPTIFDHETGEQLEITQEQYDTLKRFRGLVLPKVPDVGRAIIMGTGGDLNSTTQEQLMELFIKSTSHDKPSYTPDTIS